MLEPHQKLFIQDLQPRTTFSWEVRQHKKNTGSESQVAARCLHPPNSLARRPRDHDEIWSTACSSFHLQPWGATLLISKWSKDVKSITSKCRPWRRLSPGSTARSCTGDSSSSSVDNTPHRSFADSWAVSFQKDLTDMSTSTDVDPNGGCNMDIYGYYWDSGIITLINRPQIWGL